MLWATEPGVKVITLQACTQLLKTTFLDNVAGYYMHLPASHRRKRVCGLGVFQRADAKAFLTAVLNEFLVLVVWRQFAP